MKCLLAFKGKTKKYLVPLFVLLTIFPKLALAIFPNLQT